jgi:glutamate dehydrogenase/leucine dehydrogenase
MSNKISQKQAVVNEVMNILGSSFNPSTPAKQQLTPDNIKTIKSNIVKGIVNGSVTYNKDSSNVKEVTAYVPGLVSNHLRKAKELNGGIKYGPTTKNIINEEYNSDPISKTLSDKLSRLMPGTSEYENAKLALKHSKVFNYKVNKELKQFSMEDMPQEIQKMAIDLASSIAR